MRRSKEFWFSGPSLERERERETMKIVCGLLLLIAESVAAQGLWTFEDRHYYDPLIAGVRDAHVSALALAKATRMDFMIENDSPRRVWDIDVGGELPIVGWERTSDAGHVGAGTLGWGTWLVIDFHMIEDFVDESAPIVNTDYRFGGMVKAQYGLRSGNRWFAARLHAGHESTHLGDEFSIRGQRKYLTSFERINVSWEYLDLGVLYESKVGSRFASAWSIRGGITSTLPFNDTYYQVGPGSITESARGPVTTSKNWIDPYAGVDLQWDEAFRKTWDIYASAEVRWRSRYDYHKTNSDVSEERQTSVNLILGTKKTGTGKIGRASPFVRYYRGINPHGQFRNQKGYTEYGIGVRLVR
jgi:hypothetical protein